MLNGFRDPLGFECPLPLGAMYYPLGFPMELASNHQAVLDLARQRFECFRARRESPKILVEVRVEADGDGSLPRPSFRGRASLLSIYSDGRNFATCDLRGGYAFANVSECHLTSISGFAPAFLDAIVYSLLVYRRLTAIHAAAICRGGRGLLLCAPPGTGKSVMAYACAKRGWTFLSDDAVYLESTNSPARVLGKPSGVRLKESASSLFPELGDHPRTPDAHGEPHFELCSADLSDLSTAEECDAVRLVFLKRRHEEPVVCRPVSSDEAFRRLSADMPSYGEAVRTRHALAVRRLLQAPACELVYSEAVSAIPVLESLLADRPESDRLAGKDSG